MKPIDIISIYLLTYVVVMTILYGWQPSISNTFKELPKGWKWVFTLFMCVLGYLVASLEWNNTLILMGAFCWFVGFFPRFYDDQEVQHYLSALGIIATGMWQVGVVKELWCLPVAFLLVAIPIYWFKPKNFILWVELWAFTIIYIGLKI